MIIFAVFLNRSGIRYFIKIANLIPIGAAKSTAIVVVIMVIHKGNQIDALLLFKSKSPVNKILVIPYSWNPGILR